MLPLIRTSLCTLYPPAGRLPGLAETEITAFLLQLRAEAPALVWYGLALAALAWQLSPILLVGWPLPAFLLPVAVRDRYADRSTTTRIYLLRQATFLLKTFGGMAWGADPEVRRRLGHPQAMNGPSAWRQA
jgi:hypothetical protein